MRHILILLSILLLSSPLFGQSQRPETIIIPVSSLGDVSDTRKQILQNTLEDELKSHFRLVPQEKYEEVLEKVFEELEYEECSEDQCIMRVQEMLQVENVFHLQVIGEGDDTQLSLSWRTLDEKRKETDVCLVCGTFQLNDKVRGLVEKLVGVKNVEPVVVETPVYYVDKKVKGILYRREVSGEWGWYRSGDEKKDGRYVGEMINGVPNGQGTFNNRWGGKYLGKWKDGGKYGQGRETFYNGDKYVGEYKDGKYHGQGTFTWTDKGTKFIGEWKDGEKLTGKGYKLNGSFRYKLVNGKRVKP